MTNCVCEHSIDHHALSIQPGPSVMACTFVGCDCEDFMAVSSDPQTFEEAFDIVVSDPQTFEEAFDIVVADMKALMINRQRGYGPGNITAFGETGVVVRCSDKVERLKTMVKTGIEPKDEAVLDTWMDLGNYAIIAQMLRNGWFTLPLKEAQK